ncbi:Alcohol dehydrogenase superfamily zinc-containing [Macrophomina phaseolina MS6]|uniref:Alcohol dehydrogenase superfamily zinc-containing n=1 Tax=Macrophomina phaseolina (strain MS6) TaxID=1126212 RepID=K2RZ15_MACPH|nr:Alcohol dehydrogenase superfamily zinc-containing [Macrophomina phaseolina MS6]
MGTETIPDTMLACQVVEFKKPYKIHNVPVPKDDLGPNDLLVKIAVASLCHTDSMVANGIPIAQYTPPLPCTASHEGAGTIVAIGSPSTTSLRPGDRIMCGLYLHQCGTCTDCAAGTPQYCPHSAGAIGVHTHGCFAQYVRIDARNAVKLPDNVSFATAAPLACAGCTIYKGVRATGLREGEWICLPDEVAVPFHELIFRDIKIHGSLVCSPDEAREMIKMVSENGISVKTNPFQGLNEIPKLLELAHGGKMAGKGIVVVDAEQIEHEKGIGATI